MIDILMQTYYSEADNYIATGMALGVLLGMMVIAIVLFVFREAEYRNYKMWYLQLDEEEKNRYDAYLLQAQDSIEQLSKSNTRLFKRMYNNICRPKAYMLFKWMQN